MKPKWIQTDAFFSRFFSLFSTEPHWHMMLRRTSAVLSRYPLFWCDWMGHKMSSTFIWYRRVNCLRVTCTTYRWICLSVNSDSNNFLPPISWREKIKILYHNRFLKFFFIRVNIWVFFHRCNFFWNKSFLKIVFEWKCRQDDSWENNFASFTSWVTVGLSENTALWSFNFVPVLRVAGSSLDTR